MSANVETMFSVRETPWHGLGRIVMDAPASREALELAGLDWQVESRNIYSGTGAMAAYAARWVAKNIVAAGLAHKVEVQVAYAIGVADPVSINVETYGTEIGVTREQIQQAVRKVFDLRPAAIIDELDLKRPIYSKTAAYGHFGREDADFTWEATNKVDELKEAIKA